MRGFMIVYEKSRLRSENFRNVSRHLPELEMFPAYDGLNDIDKVSAMAVRAGWVEADYLDRGEVHDYPAKLAVDCSHLRLLETISEQSDWCLVLEDDISWNGDLDAWQQLREIVSEAEAVGVQFVLLATPSRELFVPENRIGSDLWRGLPEWGSAAYLLSPAQAGWFLDQLPLTCNIDHWYLQRAQECPDRFATHAPVFTVLGSRYKGQRGTLLGSIIWSRREDGMF